MKKKLSLLIMFALAIMLVGCSGGGEKKKVEETVNGFMTAAKTVDVAKMSTYTSDGELDDMESEDVQFILELFKKTNEKLTYKITSTEVKDNTATVKLNVTYLDSTTAVTELFTKLMTYTTEPTADEKKAIIADLNVGDQTITKDITVNLEKDDANWIIDGENMELMDACFANFMTLTSSSGLLQ